MPKTKRLTNNEIAEQITARLVAELKNGNAPWLKPWKSAGSFHQNVRYYNSAKPRPYRGINVFLLAMESMSKGYTQPYWLTYKQANELATAQWEKQGKPHVYRTFEKKDRKTGEVTSERRLVPDTGGVRKGEKSTSIVFWRTIKIKDKTTGDDKVIPLARFFHVFNVDQCDNLGLKPKVADTDKADNDPIAEAEAILNGWTDEPPVIHGGDSAYYMPKADKIGLPHMADFNTADDYYFTRFHEGVHATGHKDRLNRKEVATASITFGSDDYSREELVAELGSAILGAHAGITSDRSVTNQAAYLRSWIKAFQNDPHMIMKAAADANKAADSILGTTYVFEADEAETTSSTDNDNASQTATAAV